MALHRAGLESGRGRALGDSDCRGSQRRGLGGPERRFRQLHRTWQKRHKEQVDMMDRGSFMISLCPVGDTEARWRMKGVGCPECPQREDSVSQQLWSGV